MSKLGGASLNQESGSCAHARSLWGIITVSKSFLILPYKSTFFFSLLCQVLVIAYDLEALRWCGPDYSISFPNNLLSRSSLCWESNSIFSSTVTQPHHREELLCRHRSSDR
ncbi:hypothetical protein K439DRAFT_653632 [Ramaria rubella]|nr:hypothetical protein K439DRAFT_653632 [Ramaria rubella]